MTRNQILFLKDILNAMNRIEEYIVGIDVDTFHEDQMRIDAVVRNLEVIGEAAKYVSDDLRQQYSEVPWKSMIGLRNVLIHEYFGIDEQIVWEIVTLDFPRTKLLIEEVLKDSIK